MTNFKERGAQIRVIAMGLVVDYLEHHPDGRADGCGIKQSVICRECGLDWQHFDKATLSNQQYWTVAILKQLEEEGLVVQVRPSGPWRMAA